MADYLIHYNKNHSKANGQFISGDGDGDGVTNDHANQKKQLTPEEKKKRAKRNAWIAVGAGAVGTAVAATALIITRNKNKKPSSVSSTVKLIGEKTVKTHNTEGFKESWQKIRSNSNLSTDDKFNKYSDLIKSISINPYDDMF